MPSSTGARLAFVALLVVLPLATPSLMAQAPATLGPTVAITESGHVMGDSITFVWSGVPDATHYHVRVEDAVTLQVDDYYPAEAASCATGGGVCTVTLATTGFTPGTGQWTVRAWSATAEGPWTEPKLFTYAEVDAYGTVGTGEAAGDTLASTSELSDPGTLPAMTLAVDSIVGTPNQVIVTGTSVVTLSTPQDIDTSALFQVAGLGIGTPASSGNLEMAAGGKWLPDSDSSTALNIAKADGTPFMTFDYTNNRIGIGPGNSAPVNSLIDMRTEQGEGFASVQGTHYSNAVGGPQQRFRKGRGTIAAPSAALADDTLGTFNFWGYGTTGFGGRVGQFALKADENFTDSAGGTQWRFQASPVGSKNDVTVFAVNGSAIFSLGDAPAIPATGTVGLILEDGTALSSMGSNTAGLYADDVGGTTELFAIDEAGTATQLTGGVSKLKGYTVAGLPTGVQGDTAFVTDASAPTYLAPISGGGAVVAPVFYDGTNWVAH